MLLLLLLAGAYLVFVATRAVYIARTEVPGPWYTIITAIPLKYREFTKDRRRWIHRLHQHFGPVVRLGPNEVSFSNLEGMKEIYQSGGSGYDKTEFYNLFKQYDERTMFSTLNRHDHAQRKKTFAERYAMTSVVKPQVLEAISERAANVASICKASIACGYLDVYVTLHCYALDCASHFLLAPNGTRSLDNAADFKLMQELSYHDSIRSRLVHYYLPALEKLVRAFGGKPCSLSQDYVLKTVEDPVAAPLNESLLVKLKSKSSQLSNVQAAAECMDHLAAGIDTTGDALCFLMHELSLPRSQHVQRRLQEELLAHPGGNASDLLYLDAVVKEGLRLFPPIPMSLPRYVPSGGRQICGYDLPAGSIVSCQAYSLHLLNEDVFSQPELFLPERWLEKVGEVDRNRLFFAFASGGRGCIGKNLALVEMKTLLREVYSRFSTSVAPEMAGDMTIDDQIIASRPRDQTCLLSFTEIAEGA